MSTSLTLLLAFTATTAAGASPAWFASSLSDHMVLQQAPARANLWGFTTDGSSPVTLTMTQPHHPPATYPALLEALPGGNFSWSVVLPAVFASRDRAGAVPYSFTVSQAEGSQSIRDVLFGEVWVCSGQSNMAFLLENAFNGSELLQDANNHPELRFMTTRKTTSAVPLRELIGPLPLPWSVSSNLSASDDNKVDTQQPLRGDTSGHMLGDDDWLYMSAVCYLYGRELHQALAVPVGLINSNWGGTAIQDWSSTEALAECPGSQEAHGLGVATHLFNAMLAPLLNHTIKGFIWYQGEANGGAPVKYGCQQRALVADLRNKWHVASHAQTPDDFPFGICEIAPVIGDPFAATGVRWFQTGSNGNGTEQSAFGHLPNPVMPNTFMATTIDLGDSQSPFGSVHPRYKTQVATRLALAGRKVAYGHHVEAGPVFARAVHTGDTVVLGFNGTGQAGLELRAMNISTKFDQGNWTGETPFEVCVPVDSKLTEPCGVLSTTEGWSLAPSAQLGPDGTTVVLSGLSSAVRAVRYAWRAYPCEHLGCGVYSKAEGLPPPAFWAALK